MNAVMLPFTAFVPDCAESVPDGSLLQTTTEPETEPKYGAATTVLGTQTV